MHQNNAVGFTAVNYQQNFGEYMNVMRRPSCDLFGSHQIVRQVKSSADFAEDLGLPRYKM